MCDRDRYFVELRDVLVGIFVRQTYCLGVLVRIRNKSLVRFDQLASDSQVSLVFEPRFMYNVSTFATFSGVVILVSFTNVGVYGVSDNFLTFCSTSSCILLLGVHDVFRNDDIWQRYNRRKSGVSCGDL